MSSDLQKGNILNKFKLDPKCFKNELGYAITNRSILLPCCRCDDELNNNDPLYKQLCSVGDISCYDSIDDILKTKPWQKFFKSLKNNVGLPVCRISCKANIAKEQKQINQEYDPENKKILEHIEK